jgi:hypothetical protein
MERNTADGVLVIEKLRPVQRMCVAANVLPARPDGEADGECRSQSKDRARGTVSCSGRVSTVGGKLNLGA